MNIRRSQTLESIDLIRDNLLRSERITLARIDDMRAHGMVPSTQTGGCHTLWILGHLAFIETLVIRTYMLGEANPLTAWETIFDGSSISQSSDDFPVFETVLHQCRAARAATNSLLASLAEENLDTVSAACPPGAEELFGTWRLCFQYAADHWLMHRGQLADARHMAGITRMWY